MLCLAPCTAIAERFDIVTFDAPPGWERQATANGLVFDLRTAGADFCQIHLSKSRKLVATLAGGTGPHLVGAGCTPDPDRRGFDATRHDLGNGLTLAQRFAQVRAGSGSYITMLNLFQRDDRLVMVVVNADPKGFQRCEPAIGEFLAGLKLDKGGDGAALTVTAAVRPAVGGAIRKLGRRDLAIRVDRRHGHSGRADAGAQRDRDPVRARRHVRITNGVAVPGSSNFAESETGTYRSEGQRILMRPKQARSGPGPYTLDWFFGDHPDYRGNWGLILRSNANWLGGDKDSWRTFKPAE